MTPYKLRSEGLQMRVFRSWASGSSTRSLLESAGIPKTSLRRMIAHVMASVSLVLACPPSRSAASSAIAGAADAEICAAHLAEYGRTLCERVRIGCARAWPAPPSGLIT